MVIWPWGVAELKLPDGSGGVSGAGTPCVLLGTRTASAQVVKAAVAGLWMCPTACSSLLSFCVECKYRSMLLQLCNTNPAQTSKATQLNIRVA
eukprot:1601241-Amphidinium_carterae.1